MGVLTGLTDAWVHNAAPLHNGYQATGLFREGRWTQKGLNQQEQSQSKWQLLRNITSSLQNPTTSLGKSWEHYRENGWGWEKGTCSRAGSSWTPRVLKRRPKARLTKDGIETAMDEELWDRKTLRWNCRGRLSLVPPCGFNLNAVLDGQHVCQGQKLWEPKSYGIDWISKC